MKLAWLKIKIFAWRIMKIPCLLQVQKLLGGIASLSLIEIEQVKNLCVLGLSTEQIVQYVRGVRILAALKEALASKGFSDSEIEQLINNHRSNAMGGESVEDIIRKISNTISGLKNK